MVNKIPYSIMNSKEDFKLGKLRKTEKAKDLPKRRSYQHRTEYCFLMYLRPVMRWATDYTGFQKREVEALLYLNGMGEFTGRQYYQYFRIVHMHAKFSLKEFIEKGWIIESIRSNGAKLSRLYTLSHKGKLFCNKIHKMLLGEVEVPESWIEKRYVPDGEMEEVKADYYYKQVFKKMRRNKKV